MSLEEETLRPYPIDPNQDKVVRKILRIKEKGPVSRTKAFLTNTMEGASRSIRKCVTPSSKDQYVEKKEAYEIIHPLVCTSIYAMDSKYFYALQEGRIWFKPIATHPDSRWKIFNDHGYTSAARIPIISISADGDNLIAVDQNQVIHYAKTNKVICEVSFIRPQWRIIESNVSWKVKWFSMTGVSIIVNLVKDPTLRSVPHARSIVVSHKGQDTLYYTDMNGKKHPDPYVGVSTIYTLNDDGTRIYFADPWLHNKFQNEITGPEDGRFKAETLATSGSTLMLFQRARDEFGQEINKMYTRFADFDSIGSNPALKATYNKNNKVPLIRYLPSEDWLRQPSIRLTGKARLTKNIAILQIGRGQDHRELRVQGHNTEGQTGYYFKNIYDLAWVFERTDNVVINENEFLSSHVPCEGFEQGPKLTEDYPNGTFKSRSLNISFGIILENFSRRGLNERCLHTKLVLTLDNGFKMSLPLYARKGWGSLMGISNKTLWKMIIPDDYFSENDTQVQEILNRLFKNQRRHPVNVYEGLDEIRITNVFGRRAKFEFIFRNKQS